MLKSTFKSILCLGGSLPSKELINNFDDLFMVAADGAANKLLNLGLRANLIIGDGDSLKNKQLFSGSEIILNNDQNSTDFEKCIDEMAKRDLFPCIIFGIYGGEIDHSQYNITCFMKYAKSYKMIFIDKQNECMVKLGLAVFSKLKINLKKSTTISLLPHAKAQVSTNGLKWNLNNQILSMLKKSSIRNKSIDKQISITVHSGRILVVLNYDDVISIHQDFPNTPTCHKGHRSAH